MRTTKASLAMRPLAALAGASALAYVLLALTTPRHCSRRRRCAAPARNPPDSRSARCAGARGAAERHQRARRAGHPQARRCCVSSDVHLRADSDIRGGDGDEVPARGHGPGELLRARCDAVVRRGTLSGEADEPPSACWLKRKAGPLQYKRDVTVCIPSKGARGARRRHRRHQPRAA